VNDSAQELIEAVGRLRDCIRKMGSHADVAVIVLSGGAAGKYQAQTALHASPTYRDMLWDPHRQLPDGVIAIVEGVRISAGMPVEREN
jgi:hypothetical protein